jgi:eukaryotic-like serine/threonine-protein kinase
VAAPADAPVEGEAAGVASSEKWEFEKGAEFALQRFAVRLLGGGERYETYLAWDDRLFSLVVVKIVRPHLVEDAHSLRGLAAEVRLLELLKHPVLVRSFDAVLDAPRPHVVLEHLEGPRLSTLIRKYGPVAREQLLPLGLQLCSALHYLAGEGIAHLDVKPSNIIMGAPARLIDLSIARPLEELARTRHRVGTDAYMAPEQCDPDGRGPVTTAADVWGVGATSITPRRANSPFPSRRPGRSASLSCGMPPPHCPTASHSTCRSFSPPASIPIRPRDPRRPSSQRSSSSSSTPCRSASCSDGAAYGRDSRSPVPLHGRKGEVCRTSP